MAAFLDFLAVFLLLLFCGFALLSLIFGLPGTVLILAAALLYGWSESFEHLGPGVLAWLAAMAVAAEGLELWAASRTAAAARPSRRVAVAVLLGGFAGGLAGVPFFFGLGSLPGALLGAFAGAAVAVVSEGGSRDDVLAAGSAAFRGRLLGFVLKAAIAVAMVAVVIAALL